MGIATNCFVTLAIQGTDQPPVEGRRTQRDICNFHLAASAFATGLPGTRAPAAPASSQRATLISAGPKNNPPNKPGNHKPHGADYMNRTKQNRPYEIKHVPCLHPHMSAF